MSKDKIGFFGASVTQQKNGYVNYFEKLDLDKKFIVTKYGFWIDAFI